MDKIKKTVRYNALLHIYGSLLSKTQFAFADAYFSYDLSLSEIAEAHDVSRSAVEDAIKKALKKLDEYEKNLKVLENNNQILSLIEKAKDTEGKEKIELLEEMERIIYRYGI
ncbi:MAG: DNA-binding protein [Bacilli bacterium]|nr:DNA-binding protein [Bacilli bacterium]